MAEFLTTHGIAYHIEGVIRECKQRLILISPYIQLSDQLYQRLVEADRRGVRTIVVHGKERLRPEVLRKLDDLANERVFYCENLHAKCYCNEDSLVISSMNLYEFSEKNNREMGIIIRRETDLELFRSAMKEVQSIVTSSVPEQTVESEAIARGRHTKQDHVATKPTLKQVLLDALITVFDKEKADAYCIRCGGKIPYDSYHPLCDECYLEWADYKNPSYMERYCHGCGAVIKSSYAKPLCMNCFKKDGR